MATDSLELVLLGTSSPIHTPHRFGPSQVITDGRTRIMVDTGWGSTLRLYQAAMPPQSIDAIFITHLHSDHTTDLADFLVMRWVGGVNWRMSKSLLNINTGRLTLVSKLLRSLPVASE